MPESRAPCAINILGFSYAIAQPYSVGHTCSQAEADALNRILARGAAKGLHKVLRRALAPTGFSTCPTEGLPDVHAQGQEYIDDFALGFSNGHDYARTLRKELLRLARGFAEIELNAKGQHAGDVSAEELDELVRKWMLVDKVRAEAERRAELTQQIAQSAADELLATLGGDDDDTGTS